MNVMQMDPPRTGSSMLAMGTKVNNFQQQPDGVACPPGEMDGAYTPAPTENGVLQDGVDSSLLTNMQFHGDMNDFGEQSVHEPVMNAAGFRQQNFYGPGFPQPGSRPMYANKSPKPSQLQPGYGTPRYQVPNSNIHSGSPTPTLNQLLTQGQQKFNVPEFTDYGPGSKTPSGGPFEGPAMWTGSQQQQQSQRMDMYSPAGVPLGNQMPGNYDMRRAPAGMPPSYGPGAQYGGNGMQPFTGATPRHMPGQGQPHGYSPQDMLGDPSGQDLAIDDRMVADGRGSLQNMPGHMHHNQLLPGMGSHGLRPMQPMSPMMPGGCGQMMPPPPTSMNMYGKVLPMPMNSQQFPGSLPPPMMGYGQQMPPGFHGSPQQQPPHMPGYMPYPGFDPQQMAPGGNTMFGQSGMLPRPSMAMGDQMQPRKIMPNNTNGIMAEGGHKAAPKKKHRKDASGGGGKVSSKPVAPSPSPSDSSSCSGLDRPSGSVSMQGFDSSMDGGGSGGSLGALSCWPGTGPAGVGGGASSATSTSSQNAGGSGAHGPSAAASECVTKLYSMGQEPERKPFLDRLIALMDDKGTPISTMPLMAKQPLDLYRFYLTVKERGGFEQVSKRKLWKEIGNCIHIGASTYAAFTLKKAYLTYLLSYECKFDRNGHDPQTIISAMEAKNANAKKNSLRKKMAAAAAAAAAAAGGMASSSGTSSPPDSAGQCNQIDGGMVAPPPFRPSGMLGASTEGTFSPALSVSRDDSSSAASSHGSDALAGQQQLLGAAACSNGDATAGVAPTAASGGATAASLPGTRPNAAAADSTARSAIDASSTDDPKPPEPAAHLQSGGDGGNGPVVQGVGSAAAARSATSGSVAAAGVAPSAGGGDDVVPAASRAALSAGAVAASEQLPAGGSSKGAEAAAVATNGYGSQSGWQQPQQQHSFFDSNSMDEALSSLAAFAEPPLPSSQQQQQQLPPLPTSYGMHAAMQQQLQGQGQRNGADAASLAMMQQQPGPSHPGSGFGPQQLRTAGAMPVMRPLPSQQQQQGMFSMGSQQHAMASLNHQRDSFMPGSAQSPRPPVGMSGMGLNAHSASNAYGTDSADGSGGGSRYQSGAGVQFSPWGYAGAANDPAYLMQQQQMATARAVNNGEGWNNSQDQQQHSAPHFGPATSTGQPYGYMQQQPSSTGMLVMHDAGPGMQSGPGGDLGAQQQWQQMQQQRFGPADSGQRTPMPPGYPATLPPQQSAGGPPPRMGPGGSAATSTPPRQVSSPLVEPQKASSGSAAAKSSTSRSGSKSKAALADAAAAASGVTTPDVTIVRELVLPPGCVEAVQPKTVRRRKVLSCKDVGHVDPARIMMSLKCGLLAESTWALDVLNILLRDDSAVGFFSLARVPGLLEAVLQHYIQLLSDMFPEFDLTVGGVPYSAAARARAQRSSAEPCLLAGGFAAGTVAGTPSEEEVASVDEKDKRVIVRCSHTDYTWRTRTGVIVRVDDQGPAIGDDGPKKSPSVDCCGAEPDAATEQNVRTVDGTTVPLHSPGGCNGCWSGASPAIAPTGVNTSAPHIVSQSRAGQLQSGLAKRLFYGSGPLRSPSSRSQGCGSVNPAPPPASSSDTAAIGGTSKVISRSGVVDKSPDGAAASRDDGLVADAVAAASNNQNPSALRPAAVSSGAVGRKRPLSCSSHRDCDDDGEEPSFVREEPLLSLADDDQEAVAARCLCAANIVRSFSFVPGNERLMCASPLLIGALGALLRMRCTRGSGRRGRADGSSAATVGASEEDDAVAAAAALWPWPYIDELREDALVTVSNMSGHLDLSAFDQDVCLPLLDALLYWATCPAAYARDPFAGALAAAQAAAPGGGSGAAGAASAAAAFGTLPTPQTLAVEAMCKLCVHAGNVDLLLATPPWRRLVALFGELARLVAEAREPALREFAIVLASGLVQADSGVARALAAHEPGSVGLLLSFLEAAEQNAMQMMHLHGVGALRDNPEIMGTSPEMVRRVAAVLFVMAQVPDNRPLFRQQQSRLLSLVMSPIFDQAVAWSVAGVLFECSRP